MTYEFAMKNVACLKALGQTRVYLWSKDVEPPWHIAGKCEPGSSYRMNIATSVRFSGEREGLTFEWNFDLE